MHEILLVFINFRRLKMFIFYTENQGECRFFFQSVRVAGYPGEG